MAVNYFEPGSAIYILKDVPLDITYNHTWYFSTPQEQLDHFRRQTLVQQIGGTQYQRYDNTAINVQMPMSKLYGANYMYFVNDVVVDSGVDIGVDISGRRLKYFYAFITDVEYVNPNTSRIYYEIDYMQSFMFDYVLGDSFVVREHSKTDIAGQNIVDEGFGNLPYEYSENKIYSPTTNSWYVIWQDADPYSYDDKWSGLPPGFYSGIFNGVKYKYKKIDANLSNDEICDTVRVLVSELKSANVGKAYMIPNWAFRINRINKDTPSYAVNYTTQNIRYDGGFHIPNYNKQWGRFDSWKPKNNKMYTYPFNKITMFTCDGAQTDYAYEYFKYLTQNDGADFSIESNFINGASMMCLPLNYLGADRDYTHILNISDLPAASFTTDAFDVWLRNNLIGQIGTSINTAVAGGTNIARAGIVGGENKSVALKTAGLSATANLAQQAISFVSSAIQAANAVDKINIGSKQITMGVGGINQSIDKNIDVSLQTFYAINFRVKTELAQVIDEFFTMYGYATNRVKTPNRNVRSRFTYTQTNGCVFKKINLPQKFANKIASIYDKGITFWKPTATIGDYKADNDVL